MTKWWNPPTFHAFDRTVAGPFARHPKNLSTAKKQPADFPPTRIMFGRRLRALALAPESDVAKFLAPGATAALPSCNRANQALSKLMTPAGMANPLALGKNRLWPGHQRHKALVWLWRIHHPHLNSRWPTARAAEGH